VRKESGTLDSLKNLFQREYSELVFCMTVGENLMALFNCGAAIGRLAIFGKWQKIQIFA
jgi:hypothetical protein